MLKHPIIAQYSEMSERERAFVCETIKKHKPKKIVEIGIAAGTNSVIILDYLHENNLLDSTTFCAIDYNTTYYRDLRSGNYMHNCGGGVESGQRKSGFLVQELVPHLTSYYNLYTGGLCANHLEKVGDGIDLCIIDTVHSSPGEGFDFLMVLPYLAENAVIILHDLSYHCFNRSNNKHANICALLFFALVGKKEIPPQYPPYEDVFQNIGSCVLSPNQKQFLEYYFRILHMPWEYMPSNEDLLVFENYILKIYGEHFAVAFKHILALQRHWFEISHLRPSFFKRLYRKLKSKLKQVFRLK